MEVLFCFHALESTKAVYWVARSYNNHDKHPMV